MGTIEIIQFLKFAPKVRFHNAISISLNMAFLEIINFSALVSKLLLFLANAVGLELILWAYATNRHTRPGRAFLLGSLYVLLWMDLDFISAQALAFLSPSMSYVAELWAFRGIYALLAVFFAAFHLFSLNFPARNALDKKRHFCGTLIFAFWAFFFVASFTPFIVKDVDFDSALLLSVWVKTGPLFWVYVAAASFALAASLSELSRNRRFADALSRQKALSFALGAGVFGIFNLLFNVVGPFFGGRWGYSGLFSLFADYAIVILLGFVVYQASRDRLFGIKVILVEIFVGLMGASLVVMPFFMGFLWQQAILLVLFTLFCFFGYLLIRSTIKEFREKELLEQKVAERTKELEDTKHNLEEINSALEVRVQARTRELEKLNRTLEEKVIARTNDLGKKIKDLETFQRITISRELKMIELKQELERLRQVQTSGSAPREQK
jgi:hypothetical protein